MSTASCFEGEDEECGIPLGVTVENKDEEGGICLQRVALREKMKNAGFVLVWLEGGI